VWFQLSGLWLCVVRSTYKFYEGKPEFLLDGVLCLSNVEKYGVAP